MCIIVAKPKGVKMPSNDILHTCWRTNNDGAGYMWSTDKGVIVKKGFMTFQALMDSLMSEENLEDKQLVIHFRIGTSGGHTPQMTHPFPVSTSFEDICATRIEPEWALAHNGVISDSRLVFDHSIMSDTAAFAMQIAPFNDFKDSEIRNEMARMGGWLKVVFLGPKDEMIILNERQGVWDKGIWYSHSGYKPYVSSYYYEDDLDIVVLDSNKNLSIQKANNEAITATIKSIAGLGKRDYIAEQMELVERENKKYIKERAEEKKKNEQNRLAFESGLELRNGVWIKKSKGVPSDKQNYALKSLTKNVLVEEKAFDDKLYNYIVLYYIDTNKAKELDDYSKQFYAKYCEEKGIENLISE